MGAVELIRRRFGRFLNAPGQPRAVTRSHPKRDLQRGRDHENSHHVGGAAGPTRHAGSAMSKPNLTHSEGGDGKIGSPSLLVMCSVNGFNAAVSWTATSESETCSR